MLNALPNRNSTEPDNGLVPVAKLAELTPGKMKRCIAKGQPVLVTRIIKDSSDPSGDIAAFSSICPHALGDLSQGWLSGNEIDCPVHFYRFDIRTGECTYPKGGPRLRLYTVKIEGSTVLVKIERPKWMDDTDVGDVK